MKSIDSGVCHKPWSILWWIVRTYLLTIKNRVVQFLQSICSPLHTINKRKQYPRVIIDLDNVDLVLLNVQTSRQEALLYVFEDNEAVIKTIIKGRCPTMRHVSWTNRVALDWSLDLINLDHQIQIKHIDTENQFADMLTKGKFTRDEWNHLLFVQH